TYDLTANLREFLRESDSADFSLRASVLRKYNQAQISARVAAESIEGASPLSLVQASEISDHAIFATLSRIERRMNNRKVWMKTRAVQQDTRRELDAIAAHTDAKSVRRLQARCLLSMGDTQSGLRILEELIEEDANDYAAMLELAIAAKR